MSEVKIENNVMEITEAEVKPVEEQVPQQEENHQEEIPAPMTLEKSKFHKMLDKGIARCEKRELKKAEKAAAKEAKKNDSKGMSTKKKILTGTAVAVAVLGGLALKGAANAANSNNQQPYELGPNDVKEIPDSGYPESTDVSSAPEVTIAENTES